MVVGGAGDHHAAGLAQLLQAGRDVHPVAVDVAFLGDDVAQVDTDPEGDGSEAPRLPLGHAALDRHGTRYRVDHAGELAAHCRP